jgi:predicted Zn-dependent peptidase
VLLEDHRLPTVNLGLTVRSGAGSVAVAQAGLAEFTSELMNRGAGERDALELAEAVDELGASLSVSAGWDSMRVGVSGLARDLDALLGILRDVVLMPRFDSVEAEKARGEQLASLEASDDNPRSLVRRKTVAVLYPAHRYGLPISGVPETVAGLDAAAARSLHGRFFVPGNAILSVSGDVDAQSFVEMARTAFANWEEGDLPGKTPPLPGSTPPSRRIVIVDEPDLVQTRIVLAHEGIARDDDRRIAASLMNATLGGSGFSSRLMARLRSEEGLTYGVNSGFSLRSQPGPFSVSTFTRVPETRHAVDLLLSVLEDSRGSDPQSPEELAKAKSYSVGQFGLGLETSAAVVGALVDLDVHGLPPDSLDTYRSRVKEVDVETSNGVARDLLHPERAAIVLLGPAADLRPQFEGLGEIEVISP